MVSFSVIIVLNKEIIKINTITTSNTLQCFNTIIIKIIIRIAYNQNVKKLYTT